MNKIFNMSYIGFKYKNALVLIVLLITASKSYSALPHPPSGSCKDCIKVCCKTFTTCINSNLGQCSDYLSSCNNACNLNKCFGIDYSFNCFTLDILPKPTLVGKIIGLLLSGILLSFRGFFLYKWNK